MRHTHEQVVLGQRRLPGRRAGDLPRHTRERGGERVAGVGGAGELDVQRALVLRPPQRALDRLAQHLLGDAAADFGYRLLLRQRIGIPLHMLAQVEPPIAQAGADRAEVGVVFGDLRAGFVEPCQVRNRALGCGGNDEVESAAGQRIPLPRGLCRVIVRVLRLGDRREICR